MADVLPQEVMGGYLRHDQTGLFEDGKPSRTLHGKLVFYDSMKWNEAST